MSREMDERIVDERIEDRVDRMDSREDSRESRRPLGTADLLRSTEPREDEMRSDAMRSEAIADAGKDSGVAPDSRREPLAALFDESVAADFRKRWNDVQIGFVDDPKQAVQQADELVAQVMKSLAESFARQRADIEAGVGSGTEAASTENQRVALRRYRSFFDRLLEL
jgi:hypothetical protein